MLFRSPLLQLLLLLRRLRLSRSPLRSTTTGRTPTPPTPPLSFPPDPAGRPRLLQLRIRSPFFLVLCCQRGEIDRGSRDRGSLVVCGVIGSSWFLCMDVFFGYCVCSVLTCPYMCFISSNACLFIAFIYISCVSLLCVVINHQKGGDCSAS